jgi:hypothetical protein
MLARYTGASLGLLVFTIVVTAGLIVRNPGTITPSRSIFAFFFFALIGLVLGRTAQLVVAERKHKWDTEIHKRYHGMQTSTAGDGAENRSTGQACGSIAS